MVGGSGTSQGQIRICFSYCLDLFWMSFSSGFECSLTLVFSPILMHFAVSAMFWQCFGQIRKIGNQSKV